jgi:hypothetical protein
LFKLNVGALAVEVVVVLGRLIVLLEMVDQAVAAVRQHQY